ncbi:MAG: hypothetical protein JWN75_1246 [Candidatus Saccharibacteria bacterium]|nr:hypothetical protein [Candidatus Saccharibacteria bacterium]
MGEITALVVVAPEGVHSNWTMFNTNPETWGELQKHVWSNIKWKGYTHHTSRKSTKAAIRELNAALDFDGLAVLSITYDAAAQTKEGKAALWEFLKRRKCRMVLDESPRIKTPSSQRTKTIIKAGKYAVERTILSGTPVAESPFDCYSQIKFLEENFWKRNGIGNYAAFKAEFAEIQIMQQDESGRWQPVETKEPVAPEPDDAPVFDYGDDAGAGLSDLTAADKKSNGVRYQPRAKHFENIKGYRNLDRLNALIMSIGSRVLKDDVLDLPEKLYTMRLFEMTREQSRIYQELRDDAIAWLNEQQFVSGILPIVRLLRLQQVTNGYTTPDGEDGNFTDIAGGNPRLDLQREINDDVGQQPYIVWARFQRDIDLISAQFKKDGHKVSVVDGRVVGKARERAKAQFKDGTVLRYIANPAAAAEGDTFVHCRRVTYYNNSFRLMHRQQSEDRTHRIGQKNDVLYDDIACSGTVDFKLIESLRSKINVATQVMGDTYRDWLIS